MDLELEKKSVKKSKTTTKKKRVIVEDNSSEPLGKASAMERGLAFAIDLAASFLYLFFFLNDESWSLLSSKLLLPTLYTVYLFMVVIPEALFGMGPGKFLLGLRVESHKMDSGRLSRCIFRASILRFTLFLIIPLFPFFKNGRAYYDRMLKLYVLRN